MFMIELLSDSQELVQPFVSTISTLWHLVVEATRSLSGPAVVVILSITVAWKLLTTVRI